MPAGAIDDHRVGHAVAGKLPRREAGALIARPGLVDPDMHRDPGVMGHVDGRQRGTVIHRRQPSGVAMGEDVDGPVVAFLLRYGTDQR